MNTTTSYFLKCDSCQMQATLTLSPEKLDSFLNRRPGSICRCSSNENLVVIPGVLK